MDMTNQEHFSQGATLIAHAGASDVLDSYFSAPDWVTKPVPRQPYPPLVEQLLSSIDQTRGARFLHADATIRDFASEGRDRLEFYLKKFVPSLADHPVRWVVLGGGDATLLWVQRTGYCDVRGDLVGKAEAITLALGKALCTALVVYVGADGEFEGAWAKEVWPPEQSSARYTARMLDGRGMLSRTARASSTARRGVAPFARLPF